MGSSYLLNPLDFIISTAFDLYILAVMLRFLLQLVRGDFYNPISQFLVKITSPLLRPLRRVIPGVGGIDLASMVLMLLLQMLSLELISLLHGALITPLSVIVIAVAKLIGLAISVFMVTIIIQIIISWVSPGAYSPTTSLLYSLNAPLLNRTRRLLPPVGGLDFSPMLAIMALVVLKMLLIPPLLKLAQIVG